MKTPNVVIHTNAADLGLEVLAVAHPDLEPVVCRDFAGLKECLANSKAEVVFTSNFLNEPFPQGVLFGTETVKWVQNSGSGINHLMPWDPEKVTVTNSAGVAAEAMAQYGIGMMLHYGLDVPGLQADQKTRTWASRRIGPLHGKTVLIVGLGKVGIEMARICSALGMRVLGVRAQPRPTENVEKVFAVDDLAHALPAADYIFLCLPLLPGSRGLFNREAFAAVKPGAVIVDVSRGGIIVPDSLLEALDQGRLKGAALDVTWREPLPTDDPLWARDDVLISPHCAGVYDGWERRSLEWFAENLRRWRRGEALHRVIDPERGY